MGGNGDEGRGKGASGDILGRCEGLLRLSGKKEVILW